MRDGAKKGMSYEVTSLRSGFCAGNNPLSLIRRQPA